MTEFALGMEPEPVLHRSAMLRLRVVPFFMKLLFLDGFSDAELLLSIECDSACDGVVHDCDVVFASSCAAPFADVAIASFDVAVATEFVSERDFKTAISANEAIEHGEVPS